MVAVVKALPASSMPADASRLYAKNIVNLMLLMVEDGELTPDFDDEVVAGACVTHAGEILHGASREAVEGPAETTPVVTPGAPGEALPPEDQLDPADPSEEQQ